MTMLISFKCPGPFCNRTWDGWLCWDDTPAGVVTQQHCPDYFPDFDPIGRIFIFIIYFAMKLLEFSWFWKENQI